MKRTNKNIKLVAIYASLLALIIILIQISISFRSQQPENER